MSRRGDIEQYTSRASALGYLPRRLTLGSCSSFDAVKSLYDRFVIPTAQREPRTLFFMDDADSVRWYDDDEPRKKCVFLRWRGNCFSAMSFPLRIDSMHEAVFERWLRAPIQRDAKCCICLDPLDYATQTSAGCVRCSAALCGACVLRTLSSTSSNYCPVCRQFLPAVVQ